MGESSKVESKRSGVCDYTCIKSLDEAIRAFIFKCLGFQNDEQVIGCSQSSSSADVKEGEDDTPKTDSVPSASSTDQPDIDISDDMALPFRFPPPPRPQPTTGRGPRTNSAGSS